MSKWENFSVKHKYYRFCCGVGVTQWAPWGSSRMRWGSLCCPESGAGTPAWAGSGSWWWPAPTEVTQCHNQSSFRTFAQVLRYFSQKELKKWGQSPCCWGPASCCRWPRRRPPPRRGPRRPRPWSAARGGAAASRPSPSSGCSSTSSDGRLRVACRAWNESSLRFHNHGEGLTNLC